MTTCYLSTRRPLLKIDSAKFSYGDAESSSEFNLSNFEIWAGDIVFFHGRSGCGKTTFLNLLAGVLDEGKVRREAGFTGCIGYVMHDSTLLPWKTVLANVEVESRLRNKPAQLEEFQRLCRTFDLGEISKLLPRQLSLGMRQRVEISKAISFGPELLLLDEAFAGIDAVTKMKVFGELHGWVEKSDVAMIATAHQIADALRLATKIYLIEDGRLSQHINLRTSQSARFSMSVRELLDLPEASALLDEK